MHIRLGLFFSDEEILGSFLVRIYGLFLALHIVKKNKQGFINLFKKNNLDVANRQKAPITYDLTTVCYVFKPEYIMKNKNLFSGKTGFVVIPKHRATDIDDKTDYKIAKFLSH